MLLTAAAFTAALLLAACSGSGAEESEPSPTVAPATATPAPATPAPSPTPEAAGPFEYTIQEGDTLSEIAERFGVTLFDIMEENGIVDSADIFVGQVIIIPGRTGAPAIPGRTGAPAAPTAAPGVTPDNPIGSGWLMPIEGACLPFTDDLMPGAPREYRFGVHEGVDFFSYLNCADVVMGTPVRAAGSGRIIRADHEFVEMTQSELQHYLIRSEQLGYTDTEALDRFRGRQVWIDHGNGVTTRYSHLSEIPFDIELGVTVERGELVGYVGDSGTPDAILRPGVEVHLHFEIWVGDSYLGDGLPPDQVRALYENVFAGG